MTSKDTQVMFDKVRCIHINEEFYLFFDIFISNNTIMFVSMWYPTYNINLKNVKLCFNDKEYIVNKIIHHPMIYKGHENKYICSYEYDDLKEYISINNEITFTIKYENENLEKSFTLIQNPHPHREKVLVTEFKKDWFLLKSWISYYKNLGIDYFILYYNDILDVNLKNYVEQFDNILLIEWTYPYIMKDNGLDKKHYRMLRQQLCSQTAALNICLYKYGPEIDLFFNNDLDEFLSKDTFDTIIDKKNKDIVYFSNKCKWAHLKDYKTPTKDDDYNFIFNNSGKDIVCPEDKYLKGIVNIEYAPKFVKYINCHEINSSFYNGKAIISGFFYHFLNFTDGLRRKDKKRLPNYDIDKNKVDTTANNVILTF